MYSGCAGALCRAIITQWPVRLPGQQPPEALVGREHAGQGGVDRGLGLAARSTVGAQELVLREEHTQAQKKKANKHQLFMVARAELRALLEVTGP